MSTTLFLAKLWGPTLLAVGVGMFVSRKYYIKVYKELENDALAVLLFGMVATLIGIAQLSFHSSWKTLPQIIITLLGWGTLVKGLGLIVVPDLVDRGAEWWLKKKMLPVAGLVVLVLGAYLSWFAYLK